MSKKTPKKPVKKSPAPKAKPAHPKTVKPVPKKSANPAPPAPKPAPPAKATPAPKPAPAAKAAPAKEIAARASLRSRILAQSRAKAPARPIAFSLDEARAAAKAAAKVEEHTKAEAAKAAAKAAKVPDEAGLARLSQPKHVKAASLADILGFNPKKTAAPLAEDDSAIPEKFRRHYKLLLDLRLHLTGQLDQHTEDTLKRSSKDDAGDLSGYGQHMADAGTDTFDRDFALSMVANEQEALSEIEAAIQRVKAGNYGLCEVTQKPIARERLLAVPFTRYSAEALKQIEKNRLRTRSQAGLGSELGDSEALGGGGGGGGDDSGD
jgi:RNA polymerase-binding transcription factor DksA